MFILFHRIIEYMISKKRGKNELEFPMTDPTMIIVLIHKNLDVREILSNATESIQKFHGIFSTKRFFFKPTLIINFFSFLK